MQSSISLGCSFTSSPLCVLNGILTLSTEPACYEIKGGAQWIENESIKSIKTIKVYSYQNFWRRRAKQLSQQWAFFLLYFAWFANITNVIMQFSLWLHILCALFRSAQRRWHSARFRIVNSMYVEFCRRRYFYHHGNPNQIFYSLMQLTNCFVWICVPCAVCNLYFEATNMAFVVTINCIIMYWTFYLIGSVCVFFIGHPSELNEIEYSQSWISAK